MMLWLAKCFFLGYCAPYFSPFNKALFAGFIYFLFISYFQPFHVLNKLCLSIFFLKTHIVCPCFKLSCSMVNGFMLKCVFVRMCLHSYAHWEFLSHDNCHNLSLGLMTKAKAYKGASQEWSMGGTFHVPKNVGECERMNPTFPSEFPFWGWISMDFRIFKEQLQGSNPFDWRFPYIIGKLLECKCLKCVRMTHLDT
jgi:hypothetical protein